MSRRHSLGALAVAALIAAIVIAGYAWPNALTATAAAPPSSAGEVVERTSVCPSLRLTADGQEAVTAFVDPAAPASTGTIIGGATGPRGLPAPGRAVRVEPAAPGDQIAITARDGAVGSTASVREYLDTAEEGRGLALASCRPARSEWWFVGVSGELGHIDELLLVNPTESSAVVSVEVFGPAGPIDTVGGGVVLQPGEGAVVRVDSLIPGVSTATLHVTTSGGLVAATLRSTAIDGLIPLGAEFIPAAAPPATRQLVPGVAAGPGPRELFLVAGERDAAVQLRYLTAEGERQRQQAGSIPVPAGHVVSIDLADDLAGSAAAVEVTASQPVTAAVRATEQAVLPPNATGVLNRVPVADYAWTAAQPGGSDRLLLPLSGVQQAAGQVLLSSPDAAVTVRVTTRAASGAAAQVEVEVPAGSTQAVAVPVVPGAASLITAERVAGGAGWYAAVVQSGALPSGPTQGGAPQRRPIIAAATGDDPSTKVRIPPVYPDQHTLAGASG